ncbi:MAG: hypothetical protein Q8R72_12630 [Hylemonella sp.]|nr:hypothetical protein [Hylemonella sp.]
MPFSIGRTLFAQMPPSIVINEPLPRWKAIVWSGFRVVGVALVCAALFYAGILFERYRQRGADPAPASAPASEPVSAQKTPAAPPERSNPAAAKPDVMEVRKLEGLDVQALSVVRDSAVPGQLQYEFTISNEGRLYEGTLEFLIQGSLDGRPTAWEYPPSGQRSAGRFQMRVGRYMKSEGKIQLPTGLVPEAVSIRLREPSGNIRASRGVRVPPVEQN